MRLVIEPKPDATMSAETIRTLVWNALSMCDVRIVIEDRDIDLNGTSVLEIDIEGGE